MGKYLVLTFSTALFALVGCLQNKTITLTNANGTKTLTYNCGGKLPKAESSDDEEIVLHSTYKAMEELRLQGKLVSATEMARAYSQGARTAEKAVVTYECEK